MSTSKRHLPHTIRKTNSKWIEDLNRRMKTTKLPEENLSEKSLWLWIRQWIPRHDTKNKTKQRQQKKPDKLYSIKNKHFGAPKHTIRKWKADTQKGGMSLLLHLPPFFLHKYPCSSAPFPCFWLWSFLLLFLLLFPLLSLFLLLFLLFFILGNATYIFINGTHFHFAFFFFLFLLKITREFVWGFGSLGTSLHSAAGCPPLHLSKAYQQAHTQSRLLILQT